jgi:hypothetical protein
MAALGDQRPGGIDDVEMGVEDHRISAPAAA